MRNKYRTQDYHRIKTERDGLYYAAGIPSCEWNKPELKDPKYKTIQVKDEASPVTAALQKKWMGRAMKGELFFKPWLFLICSPDSDEQALSLGYNLMKVALEQEPRIRVHITESSRVQWDKWHEESVFMLTNVFDDSPKDRIQLIRDWSFRHKESLRIMCAAGDPAVIVRKTRLKFNAVFYVDSTTVIEKSFG